MTGVQRALLGAAALMLPMLVQAQSVRGIVVGRGDSSGVPGVVVLLLDAAGTVSARALTNERGEYRLAATTPGAYRIRTMRIGFRPVVSAPVQLNGSEDVLHDPIVAGAAVALDTVRVVGRNACRRFGDSAVVTYALWEQARTAFTATDITARARTMAATLVSYERTTDPNNGRIRHQSAGIRKGFTSRPWVSRSPDSLRTFGYVDKSLQGWVTYYAPDLDVLLSSAFLEDHCFRLARGSDARRVGLEFEPTEERSGLPEIRGVVWLDRKSAELQRMEFRYTSIQRDQERHAAGGELDFVRMKNGAWAISRWHIRMPVIVERPGAEPAMIPGAPNRTERRVTEVRLAGGELALIAVGGDTLFSRPPLALRGTVIDSATGLPLAGALVALKGTSLAGRTSADGTFRVENVIPGEYSLAVSTPAMDSAGMYQQSEIVFADEAIPMVVRLKRRALFHGLVLADTTGHPVEGAVVELPELALSARADAEGRFRLYDVPRGFHMVAVRQPGFVDITTKLAFETAQIVGQRFVMARAPEPKRVIVAGETRARVREFEERRSSGIGYFVTRTQLDAKANYRIADLLAGVPGLRVIRSPGGPQAWASSGRGKTSIELERQPDDNNRNRGATPACYSDVYLDGTLVYGGTGSALFDLNTLVPPMLEGIEFYASGNAVPPEYNRQGAHCGVILFWTRRS